MSAIARTYSGETWPLLPRPRILHPGEQHVPDPVPTERYVEILQRDFGLVMDEVEVLEGRVEVLEVGLLAANARLADLERERDGLVLAAECAAAGLASQSWSSPSVRDQTWRARLANFRAGKCETTLGVVDLNDAVAFDAPARRLVRGSDCVRLAPNSFLILAALVETRGQIVKHPDLIERIWQGSLTGERAQHTLRNHLGRLRASLRKVGAGHLITTVPCVGTRLELLP